MIKQDKLIAIKMSTDLYNKLVQEAAKQDRSISALIRLIVNNYFTIKSD